MIDLKPYGLFVQNTIRPLFQDLERIVDKLERQGISFNAENFKGVLKATFLLHIWSVTCNFLAQLAGWIAVGVIGWMIFRS